MYIRSAACLSPYFPLEGERAELLARIENSRQRAASVGQRPTAGAKLNAIEPDYSKYVDPKMIRRMSRIVKMGVSTALTCLRNAGDPIPGAIITGTAYGCLEDTGIFLRKMITNQEELLSPTAFIQSTHNTVGAQIALLLKCHSYNNTIVHRAFSLEHSLTEARMLLAENMGPVLLGVIDEMTADSYALLRRFGLYDRPESHGHHPLADGYPAGEGATFFLLQQEPSGHDLACIDHVSTKLDPDASEQESLAWIASELERSGVDRSRIGTLIDGSGMLRQNQIAGLSGAAHIAFKPLCGEFPTAAGFALWLAAVSCSASFPDDPKKSALVFNRSVDGHNSLLIISAC